MSFYSQGGLCPSIHHRSHDQGGLVKGGLCLSVQRDLCPGESLSRGVSVRGASAQGGGWRSVFGISVRGEVSVWGVSVLRVSVRGSLSREVSVWGLCPGRSLSRGVSVQGGLYLGRGSLSEGSLSRRRSLSRRKSLSRRRSMSCGNTEKRDYKKERIRYQSIWGVPVREVSVWGCLSWGPGPEGLCPGGSLSRGVSVRGVSVQTETPPCMVMRRQYASYWNAFFSVMYSVHLWLKLHSAAKLGQNTHVCHK